MKISIITPAYNPGEFLLETYRSLAAQTYGNFEWIIVDDNSNDENKEIFSNIRNQAKFSVVIITNETNIRQAASKNIGLKQAKGKYIKFLDADDLLDEKHLENQLYAIEASASKQAVFSPTANFVTHIENRKINNSYKNVLAENVEQLKRFLVFPFFSHCGCLFRKEDLDSLNGFNETLVTDEDGDLILRLMLNGIVFHAVDNSFYYYRKHSFNSRVSTNDSDEKWQARLDVCLHVEKQLQGEYVVLKEALAQRLDSIGLQAYVFSKPLAKLMFEHAARIFPNYVYPGSSLQRFVRKLLGVRLYLTLKRVIAYVK